MPDGYHDIVLAAFESSEWKTSADAIFQATGVAVSVMDFGSGELLYSTGRCGFCHLATGAGTIGPESCFDVSPGQESGACRVGCRAGLSSEIRPVEYEGRIVAHIVTSGFVISTRERKRLYELLLVRGVKEESARLALKAMPIISRRQAESWTDMAAAAADAALAAERGRRVAAERGEDLSAVLAAGRRVLAATSGDAAAIEQLVADAVQLAGASSGRLYRPDTGGSLACSAHVGTDGDEDGSLALAQKAYTSRRSVLVPHEGPGAGRARVALPVAIGERTLGALEFVVASDQLPLPADRAAKLERYVRFVALTLSRLVDAEQTERAARIDEQLAGLAIGLGGKTDVDAIARVTMRAMSDAFGCHVGGMLVTAWGHERADVVLADNITEADLAGLLSEAAGQTTTYEGFDSFRARGAGRVDDTAQTHGEWSTLVAELQADDLTVGSVLVAAPGHGAFDGNDRRMLEGLAAHVAGALQRAALFERVRDDYAKTIAALSSSLDASRGETRVDATGVMEYAVLIGEELGLRRDEVDSLRFAGLVHEIGAAGLPHEIMVAPSRGAGDAVDHLGRHSEIAASVAEQIEFLKTLTPIILHHHERWDGSGYPAGLAGDAIPLLSRILAVADTFATLTASTPDRKRMTFAQARNEIESAAGSQFDPDIVHALGSALDGQARAGASGLFARGDSEASQYQA